MLAVCTAMCAGAAEIEAAGFGAVPDDNRNDFDAFRRIGDFCRENPGTVLSIAPGVYEIADSLALKIEREAISGVYGEGVQQKLFRPDGPYVSAFDLTGCKGLRINAEGVTLRLHGWYEVVSIVRADDISISGLKIVCHRPPNTVGRITKSEADGFEMCFDTERYTFIDSIVTGRVHFFDDSLKRLYTGGVGAKKLLAPGKVWCSSNRHPRLGDYCILRHGGHYRPAIMIKESSDITLSNISIHSQPGMGIVGHRSSDIAIDRLHIVPLPGDVISTNTDATHFTSCSGKLSITNSEFKGQGDDCTNIHNYYYHFYPLSDRSAEIRVENADLHALSLDYPEPGDSMIIINRRDMAEQGRYAVTAVDTCEAKWRVVISLDKPIPQDSLSNLIMTNFTRFPKATITDNKVRSHLARAFLVKSPGAYIARNDIDGSCDTAIKLGTELGWNESGPVSDIVIEDNNIRNCGYCGAKSSPTCVLLATDAAAQPPKVNRNIVIRNNTFVTDRPNAILIKDASGVEISGNKVNAADYVTTENAENVTVRP